MSRHWLEVPALLEQLALNVSQPCGSAARAMPFRSKAWDEVVVLNRAAASTAPWGPVG